MSDYAKQLNEMADLLGDTFGGAYYWNAHLSDYEVKVLNEIINTLRDIADNLESE